MRWCTGGCTAICSTWMGKSHAGDSFSSVHKWITHGRSSESEMVIRATSVGKRVLQWEGGGALMKLSHFYLKLHSALSSKGNTRPSKPLAVVPCPSFFRLEVTWPSRDLSWLLAFFFSRSHVKRTFSTNDTRESICFYMYLQPESNTPSYFASSRSSYNSLSHSTGDHSRG